MILRNGLESYTITGVYDIVLSIMINQLL